MQSFPVRSFKAKNGFEVNMLTLVESLRVECLTSQPTALPLQDLQVVFTARARVVPFEWILGTDLIFDIGVVD